MKTKRLLTFILLVFLPMIVVGFVIHQLGSVASLTQTDPVAALPPMLLTAGAMLIPLLAVVFTQLIFKEPVFKGLGVSFKLNRWWWKGWLLMPVLAIAILGVSLLMPGTHFDSNSEVMQAAMQQMPFGLGMWGMLIISLFSGLISGVTINAVFAFGEEIAWRGFLVKEFSGKNFLTVSVLIGVLWGFWHFPIILNGHNYPDHPVIGVFMMVLMCVALSPMLLYFRQKSGSVIVPAIMHGTFNGVVGVSNICLAPQNDLLIGGPGLAGLIVLLLTDTVIFIYDKFVSKDNLFCRNV